MIFPLYKNSTIGQTGIKYEQSHFLLKTYTNYTSTFLPIAILFSHMI